MTPVIVAASESTIGPTLAVILAAGMTAQWLAWRAQIPSIIALLLTGLLLGPVTGVIDPDDLLGGALFPLVSLAVAVVLFEGGLDLPPRELRHAGVVVRRLISVGAVAAFLITWFGASTILDLSSESAVVLAAVLVVTGPTVVGPLLRFVRPAGRVGPILRAESVLIDPIGATAALLAFEVAVNDAPDEALITVFGTLLLTLVAGIGIGLAAAVLLDEGFRRFLIPDQLAIPVTFGFVIGAFVLSNEVQPEAGLLSVTVLGVYLARRESATTRSVLEFSENVRTLLISVLFILLAARIDPDALSDVLLPSLGFLALLVLVARPATVLVSTLRTPLTWRERVFLMTMAPRGIVAASVSAVFAIRLEEAGIADAAKVVPIMFLVIIGTIVIYGSLAGPVARWLGLAEPHANGVLIAGAHATARGFATELGARGVTSVLVDTDPYNVTRAMAAGLAARQVSVLAEEATDTIDLRGIGRLVAMTSNDEVNALATARFARIFGRREVFQLAPDTRRQGPSVPTEFLGRVIGIDPLPFAAIDDRTRQGWRVRGTTAGPLIDDAAADDQFIAIARVVDGRIAFLCHNDALPVEGDVVGLASPSLQAELDALDSDPTRHEGSGTS